MEEKHIAKNSLFNVLYKLVNMIFPFITSIYISHILMASGVGKVGFAQNIAQYFILLAPLGILNYGTREIAKIRFDKEKVNKLFTELFLINLVSTIFFAMIYYYIIFLGAFKDDNLLYLVTGLPIIFNCINIEWYYQGQEEYVYIAIRNIAIKIISLFMMFLFVHSSEDYIVYAFIYVLGIVGNYIFNITNLLNKGIKFNFHQLNIMCHFKPIIILFCSNLAIELYTLLDTTMLGVFCKDEIVGYYTNSIKLVKIIVGLITAFGSVLLPRLSYYKSRQMQAESNRLISIVFMVMIFLVIPSGIGIEVLADKLVLGFFGLTFEPAIFTLRIAVILIFVLGFSNLFGTQVLLTYNQELKLLICTGVGAISNICANIVLIPKYQHNGAIVASVTSECLVTLLTIYFASKYIKLIISKEVIIKAMLSGGIMGASVWIVSLNITNIGCNIFVSIICGIIIYLGMNLLIKNPIVQIVKKVLI